MRSLSDIGTDVRGATDKSGDAPAGKEHSTDHHERDGDGRDVRIDQFDGGLGSAQPCTGGESAEDPESLQATESSGT